MPGLDPISERTVCTNVENLPADQISLDLYGNVERFESGKTVLSIPEDLISETNEVHADEIHSASVDNSISARGVIYSGAFNMLVLRMSDGSSGSLTFSVNEIGDKVFGAGSIVSNNLISLNKEQVNEMLCFMRIMFCHVQC